MSGATDFLRFRYAALVVGGALVLAGLGSFWFATQCTTTVAQSIWSNAGAALVTTGLVGIIYDSILKPRMLSEIKSSLDLDSAGVVAIRPIEDLSVERWRPRHRDVLVVVPDVSDWVKQRDWQFLCKRAGETQLSVKIYGKVDKSVEHGLRERILEAWNRNSPAHPSPSVKGSSLVVYGQERESQVSCYRSGDVAIVSFDAPFSSYVSGSAVGIQVEASKSELWDWILGVETRVSKDAREICRSGVPTGQWR